MENNNENTANNYNERNECYHCANMRRIPGDAHIGCSIHCMGNKFDSYGIAMGWAILLPEMDFSCFDPTWKLTKCKYFKERV